MPTPQKEKCYQKRHGDDMRVLCQEEEDELDAAVLSVKSADEFLFAFGEVEGEAVGLGQGAGEEDDRRQWLPPDVPVENAARLRVNDSFDRERAGMNDDSNDR